MIFFSSFEQYQSEYHCFSKCLALSCSEALDSQRQRSLTRAGQSVGVWWGEGASAECLSAVVLWMSSGSPHSAAVPPGLHLTLPHSRKEKKKKKQLLQDRPITALCHTRHLQWGGVEGRGGSHRSTLLLSPPPSPISQFFDTKITLAGRCNSHISGIFASVLFIF